MRYFITVLCEDELKELVPTLIVFFNSKSLRIQCFSESLRTDFFIAVAIKIANLARLVV